MAEERVPDAPETEWQPGDDVPLDMAGKVTLERPKPPTKKTPLWRRVRTSTLLAFLLLFGALSLRVADPVQIETLRNKAFDQYQRYFPRPAKNYPVAIIDLDEKALSEIGQWPWSRNRLAEMIEKLGKLGVAAIGFHIIFAEYDRTSPQKIAETFSQLSDEAKDSLNALPTNESLMAASMKKVPTVVGQVGLFTPLPAGKESTKKRTPFKAFRGNDPKPFIFQYKSLLANVAELEKNAAGHGFFSVWEEYDGVIRRVPLIARVGEKEIRPALTVEMLRAAYGTNTLLTDADEAGMKSIGMQIKGAPGQFFTIPLDGNGRIWVHFSQPAKHDTKPGDSRLYVSAADVMADRVPTKFLKGKLVLVGTSAVGLQDIRNTPVEARLPGVEVHANILESVFAAEADYQKEVQKQFKALVAGGMSKQEATQKVRGIDKRNFFLRYPAWANSAEMFLIIIAGILLIVLIPRLGPVWTLVCLVVAGAALSTLSWWLYSEEKLLFDVTYPATVTVALYALLTFANYAREAAEKKQVRGAFGQYLSPALVEQLAQDPDRLQLGGETKRMTLLFCDVRGFTSISELYKSDPQGLTTLINRLLTPLTNTILARNGTIDKYMGDCIMAFWNAPLDTPDQEADACASALQMFRDVNELNAIREEEAKSQDISFLPLNVGIGLNTGDVVVGNMGSEQRFDYSVLGDAVNTAARLEGQSKEYGCGIVIGEDTASEVVGRYALLELDQIAVKGKTEAITIFGLMGEQDYITDPEFVAYSTATEEFLKAYRAQDWDKAEKIANDCIELPEAPVGLYKMYQGRIDNYRENPPGEDWDGVYVALTK
jgi:adenylate cyclase